MGTLADLSGAPSEIVAGGKSYRLSPLSLDQNGELERWAEDESAAMAYRQARAKLLALDDALTPEDRAAILAAADEAAKSRGTALQTVRGVVKVLRLMFSRHHPGLTDDELTEIVREIGINAMHEKIDHVNGLRDGKNG